MRVPETMALEHAAPLMCAGITLYSPLKRWGAGPGKRVAIVGLGGLGHVGVQIATALGAEVEVISQTRSKEADGRRFGAVAHHALSEPDELQATVDLDHRAVDALLGDQQADRVGPAVDRGDAGHSPASTGSAAVESESATV